MTALHIWEYYFGHYEQRRLIHAIGSTRERWTAIWARFRRRTDYDTNTRLRVYSPQIARAGASSWRFCKWHSADIGDTSALFYAAAFNHLYYARVNFIEFPAWNFSPAQRLGYFLARLFTCLQCPARGIFHFYHCRWHGLLRRFPLPLAIKNAQAPACILLRPGACRIWPLMPM